MCGIDYFTVAEARWVIDRITANEAVYRCFSDNQSRQSEVLLKFNSFSVNFKAFSCLLKQQGQVNCRLIKDNN